MGTPILLLQYASYQMASSRVVLKTTPSKSGTSLRDNAFEPSIGTPLGSHQYVSTRRQRREWFVDAFIKLLGRLLENKYLGRKVKVRTWLTPRGGPRRTRHKGASVSGRLWVGASCSRGRLLERTARVLLARVVGLERSRMGYSIVALGVALSVALSVL